MNMFHRIARAALLAPALPILMAPALAAAQAPAPTSAAAKPVAAHHHPHRRHLAARQPGAVQPLAASPTPIASNTSAAPVPNEGVTPPHADAPAATTQVAPSVFQLHYPPQGDGYVTGSSPQALDDRNAAKATGVQATVPLSQ